MNRKNSLAQTYTAVEAIVTVLKEFAKLAIGEGCRAGGRKKLQRKRKTGCVGVEPALG